MNERDDTVNSDPDRSPNSTPGTALITGATAGIGLEFARQLARQGYDLVLVARDTARLDQTAEELGRAHGVTVETLPADLTDLDQMRTIEARIADPNRPIELLINNAGFGLKGRFADNTVDSEHAMLDVLVTAVMRLSHAALKAMSARGSGGIINVSSVAAFLPRGTYSAAKAYVNRFSEWAHHEYAGRGVRVMALCPGFTKTEFHERMQVKRGDGFMWLEPEFLIQQALADFAKGKAYSIPGGQYKAIIAATRMIPTPVLQRLQGIGRK